MFKNYFKTAWRNMQRHRTDSLINVTGLCVAFTSALLLFLSVYHEFSFDRFHQNAGSLYRLYFTLQRPSRTELGSAMPTPLLGVLKAAYPEVIYGARTTDGAAFIRYGNKKLESDLSFTDNDFFKMFSFPLLQGDTATALKGMNNVVLRKKTAVALFNKEQPLGKTVDLKIGNEWKPFTVSAIAADYPNNSSITFDALVPFQQAPEYAKNVDAWGNRYLEIYICLNERTTAAVFEKKLFAFVQQYLQSDIADAKRDGATPDKNGQYITLNLQPLTDLHTDNAMYLLLVIGLLITAIACINFINLSMGRSFTRSREIGLRKTLGARQKHIALQLWTEAFITCGIAFAFSCLLGYLLLPAYKQLFGMTLEKQLLLHPSTWLALFAGFALITALTAAYPSWVMGRLQVVDILKNKFSLRASSKLKNSLIVLQFTIAVFLISCTLVSWKQISYLRSRPLGFNTSQVISIPVTGEINANTALERMRQQLAAYPQVLSVSGIYNNLGQGKDGGSLSSRTGFNYQNRHIRTNWYGISYQFVNTLGLKLVEGRDFSTAFATDSSSVLINEAMAKELGEKKAVGITIQPDERPLKIIGVVKDFHFQSLRKNIEPLSMVLDRDFGVNYILVKVSAANAAGNMELLKKTWKAVSPGGDFLGSFLDENVNRQYQREEKLAKIFVTGAIIAIVLCCMGLLAMVILIVSQRIREIGIRKVLGASAGNIVQLLARDFLLLVLLAAIIAFPLAWYVMHRWLQDFAYRTTISWWLYGIAAALAIGIALLTISLKTIHAALSTPIKSLRSE